MQPTQRRLANAIRALAMDAVEAANSGHPGMPMGMADAATALFTKHLKFDASDPHWPDRDRFVLSAGHGSMLIYALPTPFYVDRPIDHAALEAAIGAGLRKLEDAGVAFEQELGSAEEVADTLAFLASPQARYITGQTIVIDGGIDNTSTSQPGITTS